MESSGTILRLAFLICSAHVSITLVSTTGLVTVKFTNCFTYFLSTNNYSLSWLRLALYLTFPILLCKQLNKSLKCFLHNSAIFSLPTTPPILLGSGVLLLLIILTSFQNSLMSLFCNFLANESFLIVFIFFFIDRREYLNRAFQFKYGVLSRFPSITPHIWRFHGSCV